MRPRRRNRIEKNVILQQRRHRPDYILVVLSALLLVVGLIVVYAISPGLAAQNDVGENYFISKQMVAIFVGVLSFVAASQIPISTWRKFTWPLVIVAIVSSIAVRLFGEEVNGAYRWLQIGGLSFQPVELIKLAVIVWAAGFLFGRMNPSDKTKNPSVLKPFALVAIICTVVVGWMQSDLGSAGVIIAVLAAMLFVAGLPLRRLMLMGLVVLAGTVLLISTSAYRRDRFMTFLNPGRDCLGTGYQTCQALIAVGSGGLFGRGLANSGQAFGYLPEAANDSIFAIMAEKFGFVGMVAVMLLFGALFARIRRVLEHAPDEYSRLIVAGILAWLSTQAFINIGAMLGLLPLKGITLPFISYGGTSVVFVTLAVGLVFQISRYTTYNVSAKKERSQRESATDWRGNRRPYNATVGRR